MAAISQALQYRPNGLSAQGTDSQDGVAQMQQFFGPLRNSDIATVAADRFAHETHNLPKAYEGRNKFLMATIDFLITKDDDWYVAGACRSKSVPPVDDGNGPSHDEYFTLALGGMVTMQNSSGGVIYPNDAIVWDFRTDHTQGPGQSNLPPKRHEQGPLRVGVRSTASWATAAPSTPSARRATAPSA